MYTNIDPCQWGHALGYASERQVERLKNKDIKIKFNDCARKKLEEHSEDL